MTLPDIIEQRLKGYKTSTPQLQASACKEILQELILLGLSRTDFFSKAAFHGGTAFRILYGLDRFSEDLDFVLIQSDSTFHFEPYLNAIRDEVRAWGAMPEVLDRSKVDQIVKKAFLKEHSIGYQLISGFRRDQKLTIKLEIDTNPPEGANTKNTLCDFPVDFFILSHDLPSMCAGKLHALLCRSYLKGRDWYDLAEYARRKTEPNLTLLKNALTQTGPYKHSVPENLDKSWLCEALQKKIDSVVISEIKKDVEPFVYNQEKLKIWDSEFFRLVAKRWLLGA
jgi:predicted nucleotidyltransferase component of viral defense system